AFRKDAGDELRRSFRFERAVEEFQHPRRVMSQELTDVLPHRLGAYAQTPRTLISPGMIGNRLTLPSSLSVAIPIDQPIDSQADQGIELIQPIRARRPEFFRMVRKTGIVEGKLLSQYVVEI